MQYTKRDWRNRNKIKTPHGLIWLTIPVQVKNKYTQKINETLVESDEWQMRHWKSIELNYKKAKYFKEVSELIRPFYFENKDQNLSSINRSLIRIICEYLGINTKITLCSDYVLSEGKNERLANLTFDSGGLIYVSGLSARDYINEDIFNKLDISIEWFDYSNYPIYSQLWGEFKHEVSILDLLFNCGKDSVNFMKSFQK